MSSVKFIYTSHPRFPLPHLATNKTTTSTSTLSHHNPPSKLHISLLDSSFNPPTLAHLALASHHHPPPTHEPYDAHILALSAKNVDKAGHDDRSTQLRLEMMTRMAKEMVNRAGAAADGALGNVGVILLEEPTFVGKSTVIKQALDDRIREIVTKEEENGVAPEVRLSFVIGWDTLTRVFAPRYYPSDESMRSTLSHFFDHEGSRFSCARRGDVPAAEEEAYLASDEVKPWIAKGVIDVWSLDDSVKDASSTEVRRRVKAGEEVKDLVLEGVAEVFTREGLYRD